MWRKFKNFIFQNTTTRQTIAKNTFWLMVSNIGGRLVRAIIIIYAARVLGAAEWGVFSYAVSLTALFTVLSDIGIGPIIIRERSKLKDKPEEEKQILSAAIFLKIILILIAIFTILFVAPYFIPQENIKKLLPFTIFLFAFDSIRNFGFSLIRSMEKMELEAGLYLLTNAAIVSFGLIFLALNPRVVSFAAAYALGGGIGAIATIYALRNEFKKILRKFPARLFTYILAAGWPLAISGILGNLMIETDILIIGWFRSAKEVGFYSAAQRIVQILYILPAILAASLLPTFSRLAQKDNAKFKRGLEDALWLIYMIAIPLSIGGILLGKEIIRFAFGQEYVEASLSFQILVATLVVNFPAAILADVLFAHDKQKCLINHTLIGGISNITLDLLLIPTYGIAGSAAATFVSQLAGNIYLWSVVRSATRPRVIPRLKKILTASAFMGIAVLALNSIGLHVLLVIAASAIIYFVIIHFLGEPLFKEIKNILNLQPAVSTAPRNSESFSE